MSKCPRSLMALASCCVCCVLGHTSSKHTVSVAFDSRLYWLLSVTQAHSAQDYTEQYLVRNQKASFQLITSFQNV